MDCQLKSNAFITHLRCQCSEAASSSLRSFFSSIFFACFDTRFSTKCLSNTTKLFESAILLMNEDICFNWVLSESIAIKAFDSKWRKRMNFGCDPAIDYVLMNFNNAVIHLNFCLNPMGSQHWAEVLELEHFWFWYDHAWDFLDRSRIGLSLWIYMQRSSFWYFSIKIVMNFIWNLGMRQCNFRFSIIAEQRSKV